jgi:predicted phosphodiesterase
MRTLTADDYGYELQCNDELQALLVLRDIRFVINGHTHRRMVRRFEHVAVLNAGTLRRADSPCVMIVDFARQEARFHDILPDATFGAGEVLSFK